MALYFIDDEKSCEDTISRLILRIKESPVIYFDTETTGLDFFVDKIILLQFGFVEDTFIVDRRKVSDGFIQNLFTKARLAKSLFVGHNIKFDMKMLITNFGVTLDRVFDTMIAEVVLNAGIGKKLYSLQELVVKYCHKDINKEVRETFYEMDYNKEITQEQITYAADDVFFLKDIFDSQTKESEEKKLQKTIGLEMDLILVVCFMEIRGISLDKDHYIKLTREAEHRSQELTQSFKKELFDVLDKRKYRTLHEFADALKIPIKKKADREKLQEITAVETSFPWFLENFNTNSHTQMLKALNLCGIKTDSTNEKILNKLEKNPLIESLLSIREVEKLISTYGENIVELVHPKTGRIHTEYFQVGTTTGRFSSKNPNLQNLPRSGGYREEFIAEEGFSLISADYSQQEYRLVGAISREPKIIQAYLAGSDMHTATAANIFGKKLEEVTPQERNLGKTLNFAILYGTTEYGLMKNFSVPREEALKMLDSFYKGYPVLTAFKNAVEEKILSVRYSITPFGRKRFFNPKPIFGTARDIDKIESGVKREGFNTIIQGGGADITKLAMLSLFKNNPFGDSFRPLLQVHDEIVVECRDSIIEQGEEYMKSEMLKAFQPFLGEIPAKVDARVSKRWGKG